MTWRTHDPAHQSEPNNSDYMQFQVHMKCLENTRHQATKFQQTSRHCRHLFWSGYPRNKSLGKQPGYRWLIWEQEGGGGQERAVKNMRKLVRLDPTGGLWGTLENVQQVCLWSMGSQRMYPLLFSSANLMVALRIINSLTLSYPISRLSEFLVFGEIPEEWERKDLISMKSGGPRGLSWAAKTICYTQIAFSDPNFVIFVEFSLTPTHLESRSHR